MNEKTEPEKEYPYIDRPVWLYSRSSDKKISVLMQQMHELLEEAQRRSYTVVGTSQDMGTGRSMARMGLQQMMRSVKDGHVRAVLVRDLTRLSHDPAILIQILEFLQDHDTVLITTESDLRYELYLKGLENRFFQRAARKSLSLPW
jgi:DNA invertase Pin-like site-specific DNA recombinase